MSRLKNRINFTVMVIVGLILTGVGVYLYSKTQAFLDTAVMTEGVVIELQHNRDGLATPIVQYVDGNGDEQVFRARVSSKPPAYDVGERVVVAYLPGSRSEERQAHLHSNWSVLLRKYGVLAFGLLFVTLSLIFGRIFWNRDSMYIGFHWSREIPFKDDPP